MPENQQPSWEHQPEERLGNRRYDSLERLVGWSFRAGDHFLFCRVKSFREIALPSGEKVDVPAAIVCVWTARDVEPDFEASEGQSMPWAGRERDAETDLEYKRGRSYDANTGRWISQDPLGFDTGDSNQYRFSYHWTGRELDHETALQYNRVRGFPDPTQGRFIEEADSVDPNS